MGRIGMGFKRTRKIYKLRFEDPDMEGLVVRAHSTSGEDFLAIQEMAGSVTDESAAASMRLLYTTFAKVLIDWNLEYDDRPEVMPTTAESLLAQDFDFAMALINAWMKAVAGVPDELGKESTPSSPLLEASLPMEPLSVSLAS